MPDYRYELRCLVNAFEDYRGYGSSDAAVKAFEALDRARRLLELTDPTKFVVLTEPTFRLIPSQDDEITLEYQPPRGFRVADGGPTRADADGDGYCWWWDAEHQRWERAIYDNRKPSTWTHWVPHWVLSTPKEGL